MATGDKTLIKWEKANFKWSKAPTNPEGVILDGIKLKPSRPIYTWGDVALVEQALGGGGDMDEMPWTKWEDDKKEKLIKLICKVQGRTYKQTKPVKDINITAKDIRLLAEKVLGIEVITENVKF